MDIFKNDDNDQDYYVEYESGDDARNWSSGDEDEYNHELEDSTESFENELNKIREDIGRRRSVDADNDLEMQDDMYDGDGENEKRENPRKVEFNFEVPIDDGLLYDPSMDDDDATWVKKERQKYVPKKAHECKPSTEGNSNSESAASNVNSSNVKSDAILNCPACLITVCIDCQRHESYKTQYRAMFVMHCNVDRSELLRYEKKHKGKKKKTRECPGKLVSADNTEEDRETELFNPVKCAECGTVIAVYDSDEVYHFFNILASQA